MARRGLRGGSTAAAAGLLLLALVGGGSMPTAAAAASGGNVTAAGSLAVISDDQCRFNYRLRRCEPVDHCVYRYRFLDATFSESCRMRDPPPHMKPLYRSKIMGHPGLIAAGATALFGADLAALIFTPLLQNFPITFNLVQGFILCLAGDTYFQILEQGGLSVKRVGVKAYRAVRSGLIGALNNGLIHYLYYKWIDRRFPYHLFPEDKFGKPEGTFYKLSVAWCKYWIEWPTIGVYKIASMMFFTAALGGDLKGLPQKFKKRFLLTWLRSLQVWPVYDTVLYAYVPASHRPLFNTFMSILWGGYLSHISQSEGEMAAEGLVGDDTGDLLESLKGAAHAVEGGVHAMEAKIEKGAHALEEGVKRGVEAVEGAVKKGAQAVEEGVETLATKVQDAFEELGEIVEEAAMDGEEDEEDDFLDADEEEEAEWSEEEDEEDSGMHTHDAVEL